MKRIYTFGGDLVERNLTVADIIQNKKDNSDIMSVFSIPMSEQEGDEVLVEL